MRPVDGTVAKICHGICTALFCVGHLVERTLVVTLSSVGSDAKRKTAEVSTSAQSKVSEWFRMFIMYARGEVTF